MYQFPYGNTKTYCTDDCPTNGADLSGAGKGRAIVCVGGTGRRGRYLFIKIGKQFV